MPKARIIMADTPVSEPTALGVRHQEILVCTNPGQEAGSIRAIASGGEAARLMLGLAAALAGEDGR
jgi:DNA repair ATPase RecN